ncbi:MAG: hypothetical protein EXR71_15825 [Myxococcales bacterium]|nr:hypothetical protein [Myxococcales bacterium]
MRPVLLVVLFGCPWIDDATRAGLLDRDGDGVIGTSFGGDDCDDGDASVGAAGPPRYADADADGYASDTAVAMIGCPGGVGVVTLGDCDDGDALVHPGAPENCLAALDNDCDGQLGGAVCSVDGLASVVVGIDRGVPLVASQFPAAMLLQDVDGDGLVEVVASAPYAYVVAAFSVETLRVDGAHPLDDAVFRFDAVHPILGAALAAADVVGDATPDLLIGCPSTDTEADTAGEGDYVLAIELPADRRETETDALLYGVQVGGYFGQAIVSVGEVDGVGSVLVGATVEGGSGAAWLVSTSWPDREATSVSVVASVRLRGLENADGTAALVGNAAQALRTESGTLLAIAGSHADAGVPLGGAVALWAPTSPRPRCCSAARRARGAMARRATSPSAGPWQAGMWTATGRTAWWWGHRTRSVKPPMWARSLSSTSPTSGPVGGPGTPT